MEVSRVSAGHTSRLSALSNGHSAIAPPPRPRRLRERRVLHVKSCLEHAHNPAFHGSVQVSAGGCFAQTGPADKVDVLPLLQSSQRVHSSQICRSAKFCVATPGSCSTMMTVCVVALVRVIFLRVPTFHQAPLSTNKLQVRAVAGCAQAQGGQLVKMYSSIIFGVLRFQSGASNPSGCPPDPPPS